MIHRNGMNYEYLMKNGRWSVDKTVAVFWARIETSTASTKTANTDLVQNLFFFPSLISMLPEAIVQCFCGNFAIEIAAPVVQAGSVVSVFLLLYFWTNPKPNADSGTICKTNTIICFTSIKFRLGSATVGPVAAPSNNKRQSHCRVSGTAQSYFSLQTSIAAGSTQWSESVLCRMNGYMWTETPIIQYIFNFICVAARWWIYEYA